MGLIQVFAAGCFDIFNNQIFALGYFVEQVMVKALWLTRLGVTDGEGVMLIPTHADHQGGVLLKMEAGGEDQQDDQYRGDNIFHARDRRMRGGDNRGRGV